MYKLIGLRREHYIGLSVEGHNLDFNYYNSIKTRDTLLFRGVDEPEYQMAVTLSDSEGECSSGWTTASYGRIDVRNYHGSENRLGPFTHRAIKEFHTAGYDDSQDYDNELFNVSETGGDDYYPSGGYWVNPNFFEETARYDTRVVCLVMFGASNLRKSTLGMYSPGESYETDSAEELPDILVYDRVIIGNKWGHTLEQVLKRIPKDMRVILVNFREHER